MKTPFFTAKIATAAVALATAFAPVATSAAAQSYTQDTFVTAGSSNLVIKDGSQASDFALTGDGFTATVPTGEQFEVRTRDSHNELQNDSLLPPCKVTRQLENRLFVVGPKTVTVHANANACSTAGYADDKTAVFAFSNPKAGESVKAGQNYQLFWSTTGSAFSSLRLRLSVDGGKTYPTVLADGVINNGFYSWDVPMMTSTDKARVKIEAIDQANVVAFSVSSAFAISGTAPAAADSGTGEPSSPAAYSGFDADAVTAAAGSIDNDRSLVQAPMPASGAVVCTPGTRIKGASSSAVYYCGRDLKRHAFPNRRIHDSWFDDFNGVVTLEDSMLAKIQLGSNVTYRPGTRMIKLQTDPKVYAVSSGGVLRWVQDEATAQAIYGSDWNKMIDDVSDAFFFNYSVGEPLPLYVR